MGHRFGAYDARGRESSRKIAAVKYSRVRHTAGNWFLRVVVYGAIASIALAGCSSGGNGEGSADKTAGDAAGSISQDALGRVQSLSRERPCSQVAVTPIDCTAATGAKIALTAELQPGLKALSGSDITGEAVRVSDEIGKQGNEWSRIGCPNTWIPECMQPAAAIETQFSALATYTVQLTDGA